MFNPSLYSILSTAVAFIVLMVYYITVKPDFVMEIDTESAEKVMSIRICVVYALLFSSAIGLMVLGISSILKNYEEKME